jgi:hypothetical protein
MHSKYDPKECAHCSQLHICTGTVHCPCFEMIIPDQTLEYIEAHYDECLCNDCMERISAYYG